MSNNLPKGQVKDPDQLNYIGNNRNYHEWTEGVTITPVKRSDSPTKEQKKQASEQAKNLAGNNLKKRLAENEYPDLKSVKKDSKVLKQANPEYEKNQQELHKNSREVIQSNRDNVSNQISQVNPKWNSKKVPKLEKIKPPSIDGSPNKPKQSNATPQLNKESLKKELSVKAIFLSQYEEKTIIIKQKDPKTGIEIEKKITVAKHSEQNLPTDKACFDTVKTIAKRAGATVLGKDKRIQIAKSEDEKGKIVDIDTNKAIEGVNYIVSELEKNRPIVVGVSHKDANYNADEITDHFVIITGQGVDGEGHTYYKFIDPATNEAKGGDKNEKNRFYLNEETGMLSKKGADGIGKVVERRYEVSMVRLNKESESSK